MVNKWNHGPVIISSNELEEKRSIRKPGVSAALGHEKALEMLGHDYGRVGEKALRGEVRELKGQDTGC